MPSTVPERLIGCWEAVAATPPAAFAPSFDNWGNAIRTQESHNRYGAVNPQSGAMGVGQQMPPTAQALASRVGLPWRPDLMTASHPAAQQYQDRITNAALQEAWTASGGDPRTAAMYYHGGSNRAGWGPKTHRYADEVLARLGGR